jgi:multidrug efflux pump subunit AcrA (membrane-fusion protein)
MFENSGCGIGIGALLLILGFSLVGYIAFQVISPTSDAKVAIMEAKAASQQAEAENRQAQAAIEQARAAAEQARQDAKAAIEQARADARVALEEEDSEQQREDHIHRETLMQIYTIAMTQFPQRHPVASALLQFLFGVAGAIVVFLVVIWLTGRRRTP